MKRPFSVLFLVLFLATANAGGAQDLVPKPFCCEPREGVMPTVCYPRIDFTDNELAPLAHWLWEQIPGGRVELIINDHRSKTAVGWPVEPCDSIPVERLLEDYPEYYLLAVSPDGAKIWANDYGGIWNGVQTFLQLLPPATDHFSRTLPTVQCVDIEDFPRFEYRGVMLDVVRTFTPKTGVMRLIDNLARHKINRFHWHLTDDEGWRVEIKSLPELTMVGGFRGGTSPIEPKYGSPADSLYGGYYTQDDIREIVAFATLRNVEIIPEIDLPGHSRAAAIAYPSILCEGTPGERPKGYDWRNVWCASREENYALLDSIIRELAALFPSELIHLGGDEVMTRQWRNCPHCQALMRTENLSRPAELEDIFMARAIAIAAKYGKKAGVWDEASASGRLPKNTTVWGWKDVGTCRAAAVKGYPTVICAAEYFYFDMQQEVGEPGHNWAGIVPLEKVYSFDPDRMGFPTYKVGDPCGVEATFFTEKLLENGPEFLDYQLFPRVCALAEIAWTLPENHSWDDFSARLSGTHFARLDGWGVKARTSENIRKTAD